VHKRLGFPVHARKKFTHTRKTKLKCDARMVVRVVENTHSEWITHLVKLCS
jgi:hypothetical protein